MKSSGKLSSIFFANSENLISNASAIFQSVDICVSVLPCSSLDKRPFPISYSKENLFIPFPCFVLSDKTILEKGTGIAGIAVKFVMSNYSQNSNNYFENMLGETANIRSAKSPYYQVFIIPDKVPYYDKSNNIKHWEKISEHNLSKYVNLSADNIDLFLHSPNKTLVCIVHIDDVDNVHTKEEYTNFYLNNDFNIKYTDIAVYFGSSIIYNDYELFAEKVANGVRSL